MFLTEAMPAEFKTVVSGILYLTGFWEECRPQCLVGRVSRGTMTLVENS